MPNYPRVWDNASPVGGTGPTGTPANTSDDELRHLREDFQLRMSDLVQDWFADPVVLPNVTQGIQFAKRYNYTTVGPAVSNAAIIRASLIFRFQGVTDAAGDIIVNLNEFPELYDINDVNIQTKIAGILYAGAPNDFVFAFFSSINAGLKTITWNVRKADGTAANNLIVEGDIHLFFNTAPV